MKRVAFLCFLFILPLLLSAKGKQAFMVGISKYHENGRTAWTNIHGVEDVDMLEPELVSQGFSVMALRDEEATYKGIKNGLEKFIKKLRKGDIVYMHFSCHGQPVEDGLNGMPKEEADGWDESIVPIDAGIQYEAQAGGYKGDKHITDDELNVYFSKIRKIIGEKGVLYVVFDACHAGEMSRGFETVRGTNEGISRSGAMYDYHNADNQKHYESQRATGSAPALFLEACTSRERNSEIKIQGKECGSLSYNVLQALKTNPLDKNPSQFEKDVRTSTQQPRRWPRRQHLVSEKSY